MSWKRWQEPEATGRRRGGIGAWWVPWQGTVCCSATLLSRPPPASVWKAPTSLRQEPNLLCRRCPAAQLQPPACSVCFLSDSKCLIFPTKSQCLPRGTRVSAHYGRKCIQPLALANIPTTNRKGHMNQHQQQGATLLPPGQSSPTVRDRGTEATRQPLGLRSTALTTSRRSLLMFSPGTSSVAAQPGGQGKGGAMRGLGVRTSILFLGVEQSVSSPWKRCVSGRSKITRSGLNKPQASTSEHVQTRDGTILIAHLCCTKALTDTK